MTTAAESTIRVLLAEDDANARSVLTDLLESLGHTVVAQVGSGRDAVRRTQEVTPDVVLLDVHMPDGSGIDVMRHMEPAPTVGAIAMSGFAMETDFLRSREAGFHIHLTKPVEFAVLERAIGEISNGKRRRGSIVGRGANRGRSRSR